VVIYAVAVAVVAVLVYANSLPNGFTFDDVVVVQENPLVQSGTPGEILSRPYWPVEHAGRYRPEVTYRPLTVLTYRIDHALFGPDPLPFHVVNVLLHALVSVVLLLLAHAVSGSRNVALVAGLLFAVHPVHTEAVAGIVGRAELLAAAGWTGALLVHVRRPRLAPVAVFGLALAGAWSKEPAVTLPAAILLMAWFRKTLSTRETVADLAAAGLAAAWMLAARAQVLGSALSTGSGAAYWDGGSLSVRLSTALVAFGKYVQVFVFPWKLSADYSFDQIPLATGLGDVRVVIGLTLVAGCVFVAVRPFLGGRRSLAALGMGLFLVPFLPVSNFLFPLNVIVAERLLYLPSVGLCLAVGAAVGPRLGSKRRGAVLAVAAVLVIIAARSVVRNPVWGSDAALFEQTVKDAPRSARAWAGLAQVRAAQGRSGEAADCYGRALAIRPGSYAALDGLGHLAMEREAFAEALGHFREAALASPAEPGPLYNAGVVHLRGGNPQRAVDSFEAALRLDARHPGSVAGIAAAWQMMAVHSASSGRLSEAEQALLQGIARVRELGGDPSAMVAMLGEVRAEAGDAR